MTWQIARRSSRKRSWPSSTRASNVSWRTRRQVRLRRAGFPPAPRLRPRPSPDQLTCGSRRHPRHRRRRTCRRGVLESLMDSRCDDCVTFSKGYVPLRHIERRSTQRRVMLMEAALARRHQHTASTSSCCVPSHQHISRFGSAPRAPASPPHGTYTIDPRHEINTAVLHQSCPAPCPHPRARALSLQSHPRYHPRYAASAPTSISAASGEVERAVMREAARGEPSGALA